MAITSSFSQEEYTIKETSIQHNGHSLGIALYDNGVVFSQKEEQQKKNKEAVPVHNIKYASKIDNIIFDAPNSTMFNNMNISFNNGTPTFFKEEMYFSSNRSDKAEYVAKKNKKSHISKEGINKLQVYKSVKNNNWSKPELLPFNDMEYNFTSPFITADGNTLYFASDMPGGYGGYDLYMCKKSADGSWSSQLNLGEKINSATDEIFPSFYYGKLYFSTKHNSTNKADVFSSEFINDEWKAPTNVEGLNSPEDDFSVVFVDEFSGYLSSNRSGDITIDKTYFFESKLSGTKEKLTITDEYTNKTLDGVTATLENALLTDKKQFKSNSDGTLTLIVPKGKSTYVFSQEGYISKTITLNDETELDKLKNVKLLANFHGVAKNDINGKPIAGMVVKAYDPLTGELVAETTTNANGEWGLPLDKSKSYNFSFEKEGYDKTLKKNISFADADKVKNLSLIPKVNGLATNFITGEIEAGVLVQAIDPETNEVYDQMTTGEDGRWGFELPEDKEFIIRFKKDGFKQEDITLNAGERGSSMKDKLSEVKIKPEAKKGNKLEIRNIYFAFNRSKVMPESYSTLDNIVAFMKQDPKIKIELSAHTDMVGKDRYNLKLSDKRAKAAVEYLVDKGISKRRVIGKGYGEQYILNRCTSYKAKCSDEENAINRRVEIKIL